MKYDDAVRLVDRLSARLTWLGNATATDAVTPATRAWLAAERDARIAELEAHLAASEDEKRRFQRMYGKASAEIGRGRAELAREREAKAETVLTTAQMAAVTPRLSWGTARGDDPADTAKVGDELGMHWVARQLTGLGCGVYGPDKLGCTRSPHATGQHVVTTGGTVLAVWPNTADADADAALVATAEHLGNEVGPDRTAAIEGAAITLRAHWLMRPAKPGTCCCGWEWKADLGQDHFEHVAEQLAAVGALGGRTVDPERDRRRLAVERAAGAVVACWSRSEGSSLAELHDAVEALREYAPAEILGGAS